MRSLLPERTLPHAAVALAVLAASMSMLGCATSPDQQGMSEYLEDAGLTTRVKQRLASDPSAASLVLVDVETLGSVVQLRGTVRTPAQRALAERLAKAVAGVKGVRNLIDVKP